MHDMPQFYRNGLNSSPAAHSGRRPGAKIWYNNTNPRMHFSETQQMQALRGLHYLSVGQQFGVSAAYLTVRTILASSKPVQAGQRAWFLGMEQNV